MSDWRVRGVIGGKVRADIKRARVEEQIGSVIDWLDALIARNGLLGDRIGGKIITGASGNIASDVSSDTVIRWLRAEQPRADELLRKAVKATSLGNRKWLAVALRHTKPGSRDEELALKKFTDLASEQLNEWQDWKTQKIRFYMEVWHAIYYKKSKPLAGAFFRMLENEKPEFVREIKLNIEAHAPAHNGITDSQLHADTKTQVYKVVHFNGGKVTLGVDGTLQTGAINRAFEIIKRQVTRRNADWTVEIVTVDTTLTPKPDLPKFYSSSHTLTVRIKTGGKHSNEDLKVICDRADRILRRLLPDMAGVNR